MPKLKKKKPKTTKPTSSPWIEVRNSKMHGRGLFAAKNIPEGEYLIEYVGEYLTKDESNSRGWEQSDKAAETGEGAVYLFILNDDWDIDGNYEYNTARLINHSCETNCETEVYEGEDGDEIWIVSTMDIKKGTELSFNYGFDLEDYENHPCLCGTKNCVGYIAGEEFWPELAKKLKKKRAKKKKKAGVKGKKRKKK
ncbi:MAG: SET domain-containing protein-lysine N-methyltransferase [Verrucomicrobiota bacterium]